MSTTIERNLLFLKGSDSNMGYNLYFTDKRLVIVFADRKAVFLPPAAMGFMAGAEIARKARETNTPKITAPDGQSVNGLSINYEDIEKIELYQSIFGCLLRIRCKPLGKRRFGPSKHFGPNKEQMKQLLSVLPTIAALNGKLTLGGKLKIK